VTGFTIYTRAGFLTPHLKYHVAASSVSAPCDRIHNIKYTRAGFLTPYLKYHEAASSVSAPFDRIHNIYWSRLPHS
jgi:hypothetical protein